MGRCGWRSPTRRWPPSSALGGGCGTQLGGEPRRSARARSLPWRLPRCCFAATHRHHPRNFTVTFLDVGQGDATLIQAPGGFAALVDGGPPEADVASELRARGVTRLQVVVLTHAQEDHQGGLGA